LAFDAEGPGAASSRLTGDVTTAGQARDIRLTGSAPLALANRLLEPRSVFGTARYDLTVNGPPVLNSVTGQITTSDARLSLPTLGKALNNIAGQIDLATGTARLNFGAGFSDGGNVTLDGRIALGSSLPADLSVRLLDVQLRDGTFYETSLAGAITLKGPLTGGARIAGQIGLGPTEVRLAETGLSFGGEVPDGLRHIGEPASVLASRSRAGLITREGGGADGNRRAYPLDIAIDAPGRIFLRGRGLDAEVGGSVRISGTSADPRPEGSFELLRGRLDLLGKRLTLDEGAVTLAGDLVPALFLRASVPGPSLTAFVTMSGTATQPEITFSSEPDLPEDEVLAQAFFGQSLSNLSALQAARLASAIATLSGRGGGTLDKLRGAFGLADLDVTQDASGATALSFGAYIGENAYTDVTTNSVGEAQVNLKVDISDAFTIKGSADNAGDTSVGIFFERDY
jgi:translocation and assembly module TamB